MGKKHPGLARMIRAPFLSSILSPLMAGTLLSVHISGAFDVVNFLLVLILGICLHIATNVYNDIYDTIQGTDKINVNRNEFSGGSGVLLDDPALMPLMLRLARMGLGGALLAAAALFLRTEGLHRFYIAGLFLLSAFFSKYYTAPPIKLAYRGLGEFFVWFAFGPMAILVASVSQHTGFEPAIIAAMPITGISTLSILLLGQMIDLNADRDTGKWGVAVRMGNRAASRIYLAVQLILCADLVLLSVEFVPGGWPVLLGLVPYMVFLPRIWKILRSGYQNTELLKTTARLNVQLHLLFALSFSAGMAVCLIIYSSNTPKII